MKESCFKEQTGFLSNNDLLILLGITASEFYSETEHGGIYQSVLVAGVRKPG